MNKDAFTLLLTATLLSCNGQVDSQQPSGGQQSTTPGVCSPPACCVPIELSATNINAYGSAGSNVVSIVLIVERTDAAGANDRWAPTVTITTPWGDTLQCSDDSGIAGKSRFYMLTCPLSESSTPLECGASVNLQVRLQSKSYSLDGTTENQCPGGNLGITATYAVPIECPTCPPTSPDFSNTPCDMPQSSGCEYLAPTYPGGTGLLPCNCSFNSDTGARIWSCAIS
jgi:hypothetical protein